MKKLIASGFVLTTLLGTTPQISTLTTANTKLHNENNLQKGIPTSEDFEYIEKYFNSKTEQGKAHFNFPKLKNLKIGGIWVETEGYGFGYCRLHLSSSSIETFTDGGLSVTEIAMMISEACPPLAPAALVIAGVITANVFLIRSYDYGRGAGMGLYAMLIPTFTFGSD